MRGIVWRGGAAIVLAALVIQFGLSTAQAMLPCDSGCGGGGNPSACWAGPHPYCFNLTVRVNDPYQGAVGIYGFESSNDSAYPLNYTNGQVVELAAGVSYKIVAEPWHLFSFSSWVDTSNVKITSASSSPTDIVSSVTTKDTSGTLTLDLTPPKQVWGNYFGGACFPSGSYTSSAGGTAFGPAVGGSDLVPAREQNPNGTGCGMAVYEGTPGYPGVCSNGPCNPVQAIAGVACSLSCLPATGAAGFSAYQTFTATTGNWTDSAFSTTDDVVANLSLFQVDLTSFAISGCYDGDDGGGAAYLNYTIALLDVGNNTIVSSGSGAVGLPEPAPYASCGDNGWYQTGDTDECGAGPCWFDASASLSLVVGQTYDFQVTLNCSVNGSRWGPGISSDTETEVESACGPIGGGGGYLAVNVLQF